MRRALAVGAAGAAAFAVLSYSRAAPWWGGSRREAPRGEGGGAVRCVAAKGEGSEEEGWDEDYESLDGSCVLVVGDGNLSFSLALIRAFPKITLIATTFDPLAFILDRYAAGDTVAALEALGARVKTGVDATRIHESLGEDFKADRVIFNFPHVGGKSKIQKNRELITTFFQSAVRHITPAGEIWVSLVKGQGGTPDDDPRVWGDTWQVTACAATAGLVMRKICEFSPPRGYKAGGYKSLNKGFLLEGSRRHIFVPDDRGFEAQHAHPWEHDMSFWVPPAFDSGALREFVMQMAEVESIEQFDSFRRQDAMEVPGLADEYRESLSFRVTYRSSSEAVSQDTARDLQLDLRDRLGAAMKVVMR